MRRPARPRTRPIAATATCLPAYQICGVILSQSPGGERPGMGAQAP